MIDELLGLSDSIRYVAVYRDDRLETRSRSGRVGASDAESDRYEEIIVNPTLLRLTTQRGNIDCGGLDYVLIRYGNFFQLVYPVERGHVSVCIEGGAEPIGICAAVAKVVGGASE